jgi:uncharacterized membrane protein YfcA
VAEGPAGGRPLLAFAFAVPISILGGLIGLGGAEFRLPVLLGPLAQTARRAVPLNLAVSLVTIATSLAIRSRSLSFVEIGPLLPTILALIAGAAVAAFIGTALVHRISEGGLQRIILGLLLIIGVALIIEAFLPAEVPGFLPASLGIRLAAGIMFGLAIGFISSLLGVAGGEVIIPTLIFAFGVDVKTAGTASLLVSLPTVVIGIIRYARRDAYERTALSRIVAPMAVGSIIGATIGGLLVGLVSASLLKLLLGVVLIASAARIFLDVRRKGSAPEHG